MTPKDRLVVALSGRAGDAAVIRYAQWLAGRSDTVDRPPAERRPPLRAGSAAQGSVAVDEADGLVLAAPRATEYVDVSAGGAADWLAELAADAGTAAVLVGEARGGRAVTALVRRAACSVWYIPDAAAPDPSRILVPVDFSVRAADALRVATTLARLGGAAECLALHVYFDASPFADAARDGRLRAGLAETYARFMVPIDPLDVRVTPLFRACPDVAAGIHRAAAEHAADLIVLASRGRSRVAALLHESTAEQALRDCRVPLLVVKHFGAQLGLLRVLRDPAFRRRNDLRFN
jgi:nucleotide-binding universal stress UspA family protein